jgi:RimJ/RimL family protein N-acetyltransferase
MAATKVYVPTLEGRHVRLEPLARRHVDGLATASAADPSLYQWSPIPQGKSEAEKYVDTALAWQEAGTAAPFAVVRLADGAVIGSTRFWLLEYWAWPPGHALHRRTSDGQASQGDPLPDACEIGYTWYAASAIRTPVNTESKLLMLTYAFETWKVLRVCLHTDVRNAPSRAAIERIGGKFEGILRAHRMAADFIPRDSARYSIIAAEWPGVKERLVEMRDRVR